MFTPGPSNEDIAKMKNLGLTPEDYASEVVEVWPENQRAYLLFSRMQTQWRVGAGGATGLDDNVLLRRMDRMGLGSEEYDELEADIQVMELAALDAMHTRE